jgi:hypothetical protein
MVDDETIQAPSVVVRGTRTGFSQEITVADHRVQADEPFSSGGTDTGPSPYELLLAALVLHFDDSGNVRQAKELAARRNYRTTWPFEDSRRRLL